MSFWGLLVRYFLECPSAESHLMFFSWLNRVMCFGEKIPEVKCYFYRITLRVHIVSQTLHCGHWPLVIWLKSYRSALATAKFLPPLPAILYFLEGTNYTQPTLEEWKVILSLPWGQEIFINFLEFFGMGDLSILFHLFISIWTYRYLFIYISTYSQVFI